MKEIVNKTYDVVVAGGGLAGVCAAVSAARAGCSVILVERYGYLGGMATAGLVNPLQGHETKLDDGTVIPVNNGGVYKEILEALDKIGGIRRFEPHSWITFNEELLKLVLDRLIKESRVHLLFHTFVFGVEKEGDILTGIKTASKWGELTIKGRYFIDATGDADITAYSGYNSRIGRDEDGMCQPMTLNFRIGNISSDRVDRYRDKKIYDKEVNDLYAQYQKQGLIKNPRENVLTFPHMIDSIIHFNSTRVVKKSAVDTLDLTQSEMEAREQMYELYLFMKNNVKGYGQSQLLMSGTQIGVRESRRIEGVYELNEEDILSCRKFEDSIARGIYSIDIHNPSGSGTVMRKIPAGDFYTIPYRSLIPKKSQNIIVAGRPISATHSAHSAIRVMPICASIGLGAGVASALASSKKCSYQDVDPEQIQRELDKIGGLY